MIHFADLWLLLLLVPLYGLWLCVIALIRVFGRGGAAVRFSSLAQLRRFRPTTTLWLRRAFQALRLVTVALLMLAMTRPQTGRTLTEVSSEGIDIMLVLDTSGSMQALDLEEDRDVSKRRNRLQIAKSVVERFVEARDNDQIGLVVFGALAFTQCPLTLDHGILSTFLERVEIGMAGDATALGSAVGTAVKRLQDSEAESKVIIALTDGVNNAGSLTPLKAAEIAETFGIKIYTIAAGARGEAPFLVETRLGPRVYYQPNMIDEGTLQRMAEITGGAYFRAEDRQALEEIYSQIDELERTEIAMEQYMEYTERYRWFVLPAMVLLLIEVVMLGTRFRKLP